MSAQRDTGALLAQARAAAGAAYAPYSGVRVGAAVETSDGSVFTGCNIENASLGLTLCAERVAVVAAVHAGQRKIRCVAVFVEGDDRMSLEAVPCGACLQFLAEFAAPSTPVVIAGAPQRVLGDYLPLPFRLGP